MSSACNIAEKHAVTEVQIAEIMGNYRPKFTTRLYTRHTITRVHAIYTKGICLSLPEGQPEFYHSANYVQYATLEVEDAQLFIAH